MKPNFCPVCGMVRLVPIMRSFCAKEVGGPVEPAVLAYKCERGHLFAFHYDKPREKSWKHRSGHIPGRAKPRRNRICAPAA